MALLKVTSFLPGQPVKSRQLFMNTTHFSFVIPSLAEPRLHEVHCSGSYFLTDLAGANLILNTIRANSGTQGSTGLEDLIVEDETTTP